MHTTPQALTVRLLSLFEEEGPSILAPTTPTGWNGFHVPVLTAPELIAYWRACAQADPNGVWAETMPYVDDRGVLVIPAHDANPGDLDAAFQYAPSAVNGRGEHVFVVDGLCWVDEA